MTDDEELCASAHTKHQEAFLVGCMFFIEELNAKFIEENRFRFLKRHLMLFEIRNGFGLIPFELNHTYIVFIVRHKSSCEELQLFNVGREWTATAHLLALI